MLVLGIETSGGRGGVAIVKSGEVIQELNADLTMCHAAKLLGLIDRALTQGRVQLSSLELIGVSVGPGSFTGVRIGLATAKGLAMARGIPIGAVPTLDAIAFGARAESGLILAAIDAKRGEFYNCFYRCSGESIVWKGVYAASKPERIEDTARKLLAPGERLVLIGEGARELCDEFATAFRGACEVRADYSEYPRPSSVAFLAETASVKGIELDTLEPLYVRKSDAELKRENRRD